MFEQQPTLPGRPPTQPPLSTVDTVARELLNLGWLVRLHRPTAPQVPLLFVSRTAFDASPATVHVFAHHLLALEATPGEVVDVGDIDQLHQRLSHIHHHHTHEYADTRTMTAP